MFSQNKVFGIFREKLHEAGFYISPLWSAKVSDHSKYDDVALFAVRGERRPACSTIVVQDYGKDGIGIWVDDNTNTISDSVAAIIGEDS